MCENKKCNGCQFLKKNVVHNGQMTNFYNFICIHDKVNPRYINYSIPEDKEVEAPYFCPLKGTETEFISDSTPLNPRNNPIYKQTPQKSQTEKIMSTREKWDNLTPQTKWEDIKAHDIYHVPPHLGTTKRKNIEIIYVCQQYFTCKEVNDKTYYNVDYIYPSSLLYKVMVKLKK